MTTTPSDPAIAALGTPPRRRIGATLAAALLLALLLIGYVCTGPADVPVRPADAVRVFAHHLPGGGRFLAAAPSEEADAIVWQLRLPRALVAAMIGALLGLAGVALQGLLMNPLADPYTVGVSAGAAVGAAFAEVAGLAPLLFGFGVVGVSFLAALGAVALVYGLARVRGRVSVHTFLLAGVVVGTFLWSMIPLLMVLANRSNDLARIMFYLIGSVQDASWSRAAMLAPFLLVSLVCLRFWSRDLNLMTLGEESAAHLGVDIESFKRRVLFVGSLATAAAVAVGGTIGFVGLVVPHLARRLVGPDHRALLPLAALFGASLLVAADAVVRVALNEMPVGVVTSLVGAPLFCVLLRRRRAAAW